MQICVGSSYFLFHVQKINFWMLQAIPRWQEKQEFDRKYISCLWGGASWARHTPCILNRSGKTEIEIWQKNLRFLLQVGAAVRACERDQGDNCSRLRLPLKTLTPPFLRFPLRLFLDFHSTPLKFHTPLHSTPANGGRAGGSSIKKKIHLSHWKS